MGLDRVCAFGLDAGEVLMSWDWRSAKQPLSCVSRIGFAEERADMDGLLIGVFNVITQRTHKNQLGAGDEGLSLDRLRQRRTVHLRHIQIDQGRFEGVSRGGLAEQGLQGFRRPATLSPRMPDLTI